MTEPEFITNQFALAYARALHDRRRLAFNPPRDDPQAAHDYFSGYSSPINDKATETASRLLAADAKHARLSKTQR